jgi:hypothetical protein
MGVGLSQGNVTTLVTGTAANPAGNVRLTVQQTSGMTTGDAQVVSGIVGTTEANGTWGASTIVDATHIDLPVKFVNAYVSGGSVTDITAPANAINPQVAISCSKNGGISWGNPLYRSLGRQSRVKGVRASVKQMGQTETQGARWRIDVTDPVFVGFLKASMSSNPREIGA